MSLINPKIVPMICSVVLSCAVGLNSQAAVEASAPCSLSRSLEIDNTEMPRQKRTLRHQLILTQYFDSTLTRFRTTDMKVLPGLAESWLLNKHQGYITFYLSDKCGWSNGEKITAEDVATGIRALYQGMQPDIPNWHIIKGAREIFEQNKPPTTLDISVLDPSTLRIGIVGDLELALMTLSYPSFSPLPSRHPESIDDTLLLPGRLTSGPYYLTSNQKVPIEIVKNHFFCNADDIDMDKIVIHPRTDTFTDMGQFIAGKLDIIQEIPDKQIQSVIRQFAEDNRPLVRTDESGRQVYLLLNPGNPALGSLDVRRRVRDSLDFPNLLRPRFGSVELFTKADSVFYDLPNYQNIRFPSYAKDYSEGVDKLADSLKALGYTNENPLMLDLLTWPLPRFQTSATLIASMLRQAAVDIRIVPTKSVSDAFQRLSNGEFDLFLASWTLDYIDPQNNWDGINAHFLNMVHRLPEEKRQNILPDFLESLAELNQKLLNSTTSQGRFSVLQKIENRITDSSLILPLYIENYTILMQHGTQFKSDLSDSFFLTTKASC